MPLDWPGLQTAYFDIERRRLGLPSREQEAAARMKREQEAALAASQLETADVGRQRARMEIETQPALRQAQMDAMAARAEAARAAAERQPVPGRPYEAMIGGKPVLVDPATRQPIEGQSPIPPRAAGDVPAIGATLQRWNPETKQVEIIDKRTGSVVGTAAPPAAMRGQAAQMEGVSLMIGGPRDTPDADTIWSLANRINTRAGVAGRATGLARRGAAMMGEDPDVQVYQDQLAGMSSRLAKAFGESGRLSDQDIQRTVNMFPRVGDSPEVTRRKMERVQGLIFSFGDDPNANSAAVTKAFRDSMQDPASAAGAPAPPAGGETRVINGVLYQRGAGPDGRSGWVRVRQ